jgi:hypothetical protein
MRKMLGTSNAVETWRSLTTVRNQLTRLSLLMTGYRMWNTTQPRFRPCYRRALVRFLGVSVAATLGTLPFSFLMIAC